MGAKPSKTELPRRKSFSNLGRSSQRSLFQKCKLKLTRINKDIAVTKVDVEATTLQKLRDDLDVIEKDLTGLTDAVKTKNQEKYDEVYTYLQDTRAKFVEKFQASPKGVEDVNEVIFRNTHVEEVELSTQDLILKKSSVTFSEIHEDPVNHFEEPKRPSVRFGVQVLPSSSEISQVVLKRKTYPVNSPQAPKNDIPYRNTTEGSSQSAQNGTSTTTNIQSSNSFNTNTEYFSKHYVSEQYTRSDSTLGIEAINTEVNKLEGKLRYFTGSKDSQNYCILHQGLFNNLVMLDRIHSDEDPITNQEKKILKQRITELLKILECLVEPVKSDSDDDQFLPANASENFDNRPKLLTSVTAI